MPATLSFSAPRLEINDFENEINQLSNEEKKSAYDDLYGKKNTTVETPEILESCLMQMQRELNAIPASKKQSYLRAVQCCPDHTNDASFRLQFIRADFFDASKAATRFVKYWKAKEFCFGPDKAFHPLTLDDLNDDDLATFRNFGYVMLPSRDEAGRALAFTCRQKFVFKDRKNILRMLFYVVNYVLEDVSIQRNGIVTIVFEDGALDIAKVDRKLDRLMLQYINDVWPVRSMGVHMCFDSKVQELLLPFGLFLMGSKMRARFRLHPGSRKAQRFDAFQEFGIAAKSLPRIMGGMLSFDPEKFLAERRDVERARREGTK